jgi:hypothetical protein
MRLLRLSPIVIFILIIGCAPTAQMDDMVPEYNKNSSDVYSESLRKNINIQSVSGGNTKGTSPVLDNESFYSALKQAMKNDGLYTNSGERDYVLNVTILHVEKPAFGFNMTVSTQIKYILKEPDSDDQLYDKNIRTSYTAKFSNTYSGSKRLRNAIEGAAKKNIGKFLADLSELEMKNTNQEIIY